MISIQLTGGDINQRIRGIKALRSVAYLDLKQAKDVSDRVFGYPSYDHDLQKINPTCSPEPVDLEVSSVEPLIDFEYEIVDDPAKNLQVEAARLNEMAVEVLSFNMQGESAEDHIHAAEALLAFYEAHARLQVEAAQAEIADAPEGEGGLSIFRHAAEMHIAIAKAKRS